MWGPVVGSSRGVVHYHTKDLVEVVLGHLLRHVQVHLLDSHATLLLALLPSTEPGRRS